MTDQYLGPLVSGDEITSELGRRRRKDVYKTVSGSSKRLIAKKADLEEADGWQMVRKNAKSTRMAKVKAADEQLEDEVWSILAQMGFKEMSKGRQFTIAVEDGLPPRQIDVFDLRGLEQALVEIGEDDGQTLLTSLLTRSDAPSLAHFVRSLVGMDRAAAQEAFSEFLSNRSLTTPQIRCGPGHHNYRLSQRSHYVANWGSIADRLPAGWDDDEFHIVGTPYPWCETLSNDCDCHGSKGIQYTAHCSDFGLHDETDKRASKSENVRYRQYIQSMEERIAGLDEARREERLERERRSPPRGKVLFEAKPEERGGEQRGIAGPPAVAIDAVNRMVAQGLYCSIHERHHAYDEQAIRKTMARLTAAYAQMPTLNEANRALAMSKMGDIAAHWLQILQSEECAQRSVWSDEDIPDILYKYIPKERIGKGAPNSLRATQLLALNDDMECNLTTMKGREQEDTLAFLALVQSKLEEHLGITVPWEELLTRSFRYGDLRLSTFIQEYLNPRVGVVSFSTDILVPTMWAHYARNTGIVVGYDSEALSALGFELRPVIYSELAPMYRPQEDDGIRLDFVNREDMEHELRAGQKREGIPILVSTELAEFGAGWKSSARLLLVKGMSWAYEKEVRLLVDLEGARDIGEEDENGWPIKVIEPPPEAIKEIYGGANTQDANVERAIQVARGANKSGLFVGHVSSHAFRIQKTGGSKY